MGPLPPYPYQRLPPQCIRVLDLHPDRSDEPLVCNIVVQHISGKAYDALSYVWGDPTRAAAVKCIDETNEGELGVGASLARALIAFRLTDQIRRIWVDALCINQEDVAERQSQVRMMGAVFGTAEHVLCWLGPFNNQDDGGSSARLAIRFLRRFNGDAHEHLRAARQHLHFEDNSEDADGELLNSWLTIKELFDLEYFHRTWIIQEVGLARHARLYWGNQEVWVDWKEVAEFCGVMDAYGASIINHLQLKSWVANHINLVWATHPSGKPRFTFVEVLHWARVHRATDPRDYIYSLLSHPSAKLNGSLLVQPNYMMTSTQVYTGFAVNLIERTESLQILAFVEHHEESGVLTLPTWVPDWHALNLVAPLRCPTKAAAETDNRILLAETKNGMILKCRGFVIDTLRATSDMMVASEFTVTTADKEIQKKIPFLIDHIWNTTVVDPKIPLRPPREYMAALSLVLTGGYLDDLDSTSGERNEQQQSDLAALTLEYERIKLHDSLDGFFRSLTPEDKALVQKMAARGSAHQFVQEMTWTSMSRKVFRTAKGSIGLGPQIMKEGDLCVVLLGAAYPMILRRSGGHFQLVGAALLYGFMNGEAQKLCQNGTLQEQEFEII